MLVAQDPYVSTRHVPGWLKKHQSVFDLDCGPG